MFELIVELELLPLLVLSFVFLIVSLSIFRFCYVSYNVHNERISGLISPFFVALYVMFWFVVTALGLYNAVTNTYLIEDLESGRYITSEDKIIEITNLPRSPEVVYEMGDPNNSGHSIRNFKWVYVDFRNEERRLILHRTNKQAWLSTGEIVDIPKNIKTLEVTRTADSWWRGSKIQIQGEWLVWSEDFKDLRIEKETYINYNI